MNVHDLSREQMIELKIAHLMEQRNNEPISYVDLVNLDTLVPDEEIYSRFEETFFYRDDFSSSISAEKTRAQQFWEGFERVKTFSERQVEKAHQKLQDIMNRPTRLDALADHAKFCFQFNHPYGWFLLSFKPANQTEKAQFSQMMRRMKAAAHPQLDFHTLAKIGDSYVLRAIWNEHEHSNPQLCARVAANHNCPPDILREAMHHENFEVRKAAVFHPGLSERECISWAKEERNPFVIEALRSRLGRKYPEAWEIDNTPRRNFGPRSVVPSGLDAIIASAKKRTTLPGGGSPGGKDGPVGR